MASLGLFSAASSASAPGHHGTGHFTGRSLQGSLYSQRCPPRAAVLLHAKPRKVKQEAVTAYSEASVELETIVNSRDLASACADMQPGLLIRSGCPFRASKNAALDRNIRQMIDLRNPEEWVKDDKSMHPSWKEVISRERILRRSDDNKSTEWENVERDSEPEWAIELHRISVLDKNRFQKHLIYNKMDVFTIAKVRPTANL